MIFSCINLHVATWPAIEKLNEFKREKVHDMNSYGTEVSREEETAIDMQTSTFIHFNQIKLSSWLETKNNDLSKYMY